MEFNFRAVDDRPPNFYPHPPNFSERRSFFTEQALRAGYPTNVYGRNGFYQDGIETQEIIQRELEKERIREAIIAAEIARKRMIEAELRRDMIIQREIEIRREADYSMFPVPKPLPHEVMRFDPRFSMLLPPTLQHESKWEGSVEVRIGHRIENGYGRSSEDRNNFQDRREYNNFNNCQIAPLQLTIEDSHTPEASLDLTHSRRKRKAVTLPALGPSAMPSTSSKKPREEWSCALCRVSTSSEKTLNEHLQSKKHKTKAAGLIVHEGAKDATAPLSIKLDKGKIAKDSKQKIEQPPLHKLSRSQKKKKRSEKAREKVMLTTGVELQVDKPEGTEVLIPKIAEDSEKKTEQPPMQKLSKEQKKKETLKFWCEMCKVGAHCEVTLIAHINGKKHRALLKQGKNCDTAQSPIILPVLDSAEKENDAEVVKEENVKTNGNIDSVEKENDAEVAKEENVTTNGNIDSAEKENDSEVAKKENVTINGNIDSVEKENDAELAKEENVTTNGNIDSAEKENDAEVAKEGNVTTTGNIDSAVKENDAVVAKEENATTNGNIDSLEKGNDAEVAKEEKVKTIENVDSAGKENGTEVARGVKINENVDAVVADGLA